MSNNYSADYFFMKNQRQSISTVSNVNFKVNGVINKVFAAKKLRDELKKLADD